MAPHFFHHNFKMHVANSFFQICVDCLWHEHNPQFYDKVGDEEDEALRKEEVEQVGKECVADEGEELSIPNCSLSVAFEETAIGQKQKRDGDAKIGRKCTSRG